MTSVPKLHKVVRLGQTSRGRFRTLRLTIRDWSNYAGIARALRNPSDGDPDETGETIVRMWLDGANRLRVESHGQIGVANGRRWWHYDRESGSIVRSHQTHPDGELDERIDPFSHFPDARWLTRSGVKLVGATEVAGRPGIELDVDAERVWRFWLLPGTDRYRLVLDAERGILLRAECFFEGELIAVEEAVEVAFDEELPPELFEEPR